MKVVLITPPFTQLNTPYPATAYIKGFLNTLNVEAFQCDLGMEVILEVFSKKDLDVQLLDANGFMINQTKLNKGQTIGYFDTQTLYAGVYFVLISVDGQVKTTKVIIEK